MASSLTRTPSAVSNSSTASIPTTPSRSAIRTASSCAAVASSSAEPGRRRPAPRRRRRRAARSRRPATPRPGRTASAPPARRARGRMSTRSSTSSVPCRVEQVGGLLRVRRRRRRPCRRTRRAGVLRTTGQPCVGARTPSTSSTRARLRPRRLRLPGRRRAPRRRTSLSCAWTSAAGPGATRWPASSSALQVLGRHVLVVEGHDGGAVGAREQSGQVVVVAQLDVGGDERGGLVGIAGQHPQRLAERDGRLVRHPGELTAADHRHDGQARARVEPRRDHAREPTGVPTGLSAAAYTDRMPRSAQCSPACRTRGGSCSRRSPPSASSARSASSSIWASSNCSTRTPGSARSRPKLVSTLISMTVAYFAHRHWSFSHRARTGLRREYTIFVVVNGVTLLLALALVALVRYPLGHESALVLQITNVVSTALRHAHPLPRLPPMGLRRARGLRRGRVPRRDAPRRAGGGACRRGPPLSLNPVRPGCIGLRPARAAP